MVNIVHDAFSIHYKYKAHSGNFCSLYVSTSLFVRGPRFPSFRSKIHHWDILSFVLPCILIFIMQIFTDFSHFRIKSSSSQKQENVLPHLYVWLLEIIGLMQLLDWFCGKKRKALCGGTCVISSWNFYIFFPFTLFKQF